MKITLSSLLITFALLAPSYAEPPMPGSPRAMAEQFLSGVIAGDIEKSFDKLFAGSPTAASKGDALDLVKRQAQAGLPTYGRLLRFEFVEERSLGSSVDRIIYILVAEKHPLVWQFYFFRPEKTWFTDSVSFNDQYQGIPGEVSK